MDVHSPKNGINRYWSIPICQNMPIFYRPLSEVHYGWKSTKNPCAWWLNPHVFSTSYPLVSWQNYRTSPFLNFIGTSSINGDLMGIFDSYVRFYVGHFHESPESCSKFQRIHSFSSVPAIQPRPRPGHIFWRGPGWSLPLRPRTLAHQTFFITVSKKNQTEQ